MQIGELAKRSGVTVSTVRFYERLKLLPEPQRRESGYRVYSGTDLKRLLFIRHAKVLGFSLDEIHNILRMRERGHCPCSEVVGTAERHLVSVEQQITRLSTFRDALKQALKRWKKYGKQTVSADAICSLIEHTLHSTESSARGSEKSLDSIRGFRV